MPARLCLLLLVCLALEGRPFAADDQSLIRLDVHATRDGLPATELTLSDLDLLEGGISQKIEDLQHVSSSVRPFVVVLDTAHMRFEGARDVRIALGGFLDRLLDDDDQVAIITPETGVGNIAFTTKTAAISGPLQDEQTWDRARIGVRDSKEDRYAQCFPANQFRDVATEMQDRHREQVTLDMLEQLIASRGGQQERTTVIVVTNGWKLFGPSSRLGASPDGSRLGGFGGGGRGGRGGFPGVGGRGSGGRPPTAGADDDGGRGGDAVSRAECNADRVTLAGVNNALRLDRLADMANRAMVSFYPVYARGLAPQRPRTNAAADADDDDPASRADAIRQLAANTDGVTVMSAAAMDSAITRITADTSSYAVVTYHSTNTALDGRFRAITVRSSLPGVTIRARRGYRGATVDDVLRSSDGATTAVSSAFGSVVAVNPRSSFRIRAAMAGKGDSPDAILWVVGELDYRTRRELAWTAGAVADLTIVGADGREVVSKTLDVPANEAFSVAVAPDGGLQPGEYAVRVRLRPNNDGALPVSDTARVIVPAQLPVLGEAVLWRRGASTGPRYMITADPRFPRSDRIRVEIPTRSTAPATARMVDRLGNPNRIPVQVSERMDASSGVRWVVAEAALAALAPGDYAIETSVETERRITAFQLVP